ncbi:50S ribosomal protein L17 [Candidatus Roizmanbacteria bacterium RIFCSPHIGHO2_01_FULL_39_12c]|uniref:50S ribosomal protein L17 n=1 Tax=Candidatus Roizmanbacteria bacterium RIFCSPHIGHO2_01_FULL_39_12c TaxID=1802031 RepID=A0A1F7GE85_9BACT|nr:MAG: 50S ribosomal protein L17 [Candidatus Roizmanbacteria bacterium RIFCSPHIGHO2_01_FULL_39_12c]OGK47564.1 MAG: 50S ribosomal protein L17 [Candidatus Roizmanbacteria bacterium RIFCSPLOWO2_01_FULL_40_13]
MRHKVKKIKFKFGKDANKMLLRKLTRNFVTHGKIRTTLAKAKVLKSAVERLVEKTKVRSEANKNYLLKTLNDNKLVRRMFDQVGGALKDKVGGYVKIVRLGARQSDGAETAAVKWVYPVAIPEKPEEKKIKKNQKPEKAIKLVKKEQK